MLKLFCAMFLIPWNVLLAETFHSKVYAVDEEVALVRFTNGRVGFIGPGQRLLRAQALDYLSAGTNLEVQVDSENMLLFLRRAASEANLVGDGLGLVVTERPPFVPGVVGPGEARAIFERMNGNYQRISECSDRAQVWAFDEFKRSGLRSMKAFIFFTASYINRNRFKWWFHVAPMIKVNNANSVVDQVLDYRYMDRPVSVKEWSDLMVTSKRPCKVTQKFSEYDVNPQTEDCYLIFESMYYHFPLEIQNQETKGQYLNAFSESGVSAARRRAFKSK